MFHGLILTNNSAPFLIIFVLSAIFQVNLG